MAIAKNWKVIHSQKLLALKLLSSEYWENDEKIGRTRGHKWMTKLVSESKTIVQSLKIAMHKNIP